MDQKHFGEAGLTLVDGVGLKFCVHGLFGVVHMCVKFHGHWVHLAGTCFTRCPTGQKLYFDDALTWMMGFGSNLVWWSHLVVLSFTKSFKANGIPWLALPSKYPFAASTLWEFLGGVWLGK